MAINRLINAIKLITEKYDELTENNELTENDIYNQLKQFISVSMPLINKDAKRCNTWFSQGKG